MVNQRTFPWPGFALAVAAAIGLIVFGVRWDISLVVMALWIGSLYLVSGKPPESSRKPSGSPFTRDSMQSLTELSGTPFLLIEGSKITSANLQARRTLGGHIVGQDLRVAFRQPDAVKFLNSGRNGSIVVSGLARRHDIWQINRQELADGLFLIELINKTAEADISRAHTDFVANASHELRTPLSSIIGYAETLREGNGEIEAGMSQKFLDTILHEAKRLQNLVSDLMSLSRVEAEKHDLPREPVDMRPLVERAAREGAGPKRTDRIELDLEDSLTVHGDTQQLEQLVRNLVDNALKYGGTGERVTVNLSRTAEEEARLQVTDRGPGIDAEHLPHLTRRFYRTDPGRSRASGGTGLGLAIVKHIVERHRGRLDISSALGQGTTVTVRIPLAGTEREDVS